MPPPQKRTRRDATAQTADDAVVPAFKTIAEVTAVDCKPSTTPEPAEDPCTPTAVACKSEDGSTTEEEEDNYEDKHFSQVDLEMQFTIIEGGTRRGGQLLVDDYGYSYTLGNRTKKHTLWRCSVRSAALHCYTTVKQIGDSFTLSHNHAHAGQLGLDTEVISSLLLISRLHTGNVHNHLCNGRIYVCLVTIL